MRVAYFDCSAGVAGDMALGALLDAGASITELVEGLKTIPEITAEWSLTTAKVVKGKGSIAALKATVHSVYNHEPLHAPGYSRQQHHHDHDHAHVHDHDHSHGPQRNFLTISKLIQGSELPEQVKTKSIEVFHELAKAEAHTHGTSIEQVHFHEVGAVDSIIDTVGTVYALYLLKIDHVYASAIPFGQGWVSAAHGIMPVPAPATLRLLQGVPVAAGPPDAHGELVTPTGASLIKALCESFGPPPPMTPEAIGIGAGAKEFSSHANITRVIIGEHCSGNNCNLPENVGKSTLVELQANIDDMTAEAIGYVIERFMELGALDAWCVPIIMKKGRPAYQFSVLCPVEQAALFKKHMFIETTTLGIRQQQIDRFELHRKSETVTTSLGVCRVKLGYYGDKLVTVHPEYEDCRQLAKSHGMDFPTIDAMVRHQWTIKHAT